MSLRAKIEAVVYAAEEPVTLAQLATLFADEALEWKRLHQTPSDAALEAGRESANESAFDGEQEPLGEPVSEGTPSLPLTSTEPETDSSPAPDAQSSLGGSEDVLLSEEVEAKRTARQRDREVREILRGVLDELMAEYAQSDRGIEIREIAGGYRIGTKPEYHDSVRSFVKSLKPPMKLSLQALETLAVIAYKQPVTAPEVSEIRGVDTSGVLGGLMTRKLITTAGRKQVIGRPILYKTTKEFLLRFGLRDVNELPSIEEFEKLAGDLADPEISSESDNGPAEGTELPFHQDDTGELDAALDEAGLPAPSVEVAAEPIPPIAAPDREAAAGDNPLEESSKALDSVSQTVPAEEE